MHFLLLLSCAHRPVAVSVVGATIGPSTADLSPWDGIGKVPADVRSAAIAAAADVEPSAVQAAAAFVDLLDGIAPPDARGELWDAARPEVRVTLAERGDTFVPTWEGVTLRDVVLAPDARVLVRLVDVDLDDPDPIGTVELTAKELRAALGKRDEYTVATAERTQGQILSVTVRVETQAR